MYSKLRNFIYSLFLVTILSSLFPNKIFACTYEATIVGSHLDLNITSDNNYLQLVQLMHVNDLTNAPYKITALQGPIDFPWVQYFDFSQTYNGFSMVIQNRRQIADGAYWVSWIDSNHYLHIPNGIYGVDFTGTMTYSDISVEYGTMDNNGNVDTVGEPWRFCTRTGDIGSSSSTPSPSPKETPTPTPTIAPTPTPIASPTPSPTPTPTPPVSKVFFIPGLGASWNADALLNCKTDSNPNDWTLAPYASDIYTPIMTALTESGWNTIPYYYDWRKQIPDNIQSLNDLISSNQVANEKVNVVGHSMGGLIGREYVESWWGRNVNSLLTIGSPHKGSALAYPTWAAGDVWNDNFIEKMAITLYLKHCGKVFSNDRITLQQNIPSIQNLLPIDPYLQKVKSNTLYLPYANSNNWLRPFYNYWGIKTGTISGNGFNTLAAIQTKDATSKDIKEGNWLDGKASGKIYTTAGDGTVTAENSKLPGYPDISLNQTHSGLVNSIDGMSSVLSFLGSPQNLTFPSSQTEINSTLVIIGYPSNFTVTSEDGSNKKDKDGMVSFINPNSGQYKIKLLPKSNNTLFIVAQFLNNGDVKYKEYNFQGLGPKFKTIKFDSLNPTDDVLIN